VVASDVIGGNGMEWEEVRMCEEWRSIARKSKEEGWGARNACFDLTSSPPSAHCHRYFSSQYGLNESGVEAIAVQRKESGKSTHYLKIRWERVDQRGELQSMPQFQHRG
jgi:hypothetical protein